MNIDLYCNCYREKINKRVEYNQKNLMLGSIAYESKLKSELFSKGFIFDDTGDNISHLNYWFGQLTGLYWVWKNSNEEIVGTNTYRLFWGDYFLKNDFKSNTLYLPNPIDIRECVVQDIGIKNIYDHYKYCHGDMGLDLLYDLAKSKKIPISLEMIDNLKHEHLMYSFNMFISERKIFDAMCSILFQILFVFFSEYKSMGTSKDQKRIIDFLSERIIHIICRNLNHFLQLEDVKIFTLPTIHLNH